jgi:hypothetical protein
MNNSKLNDNNHFPNLIFGCLFSAFLKIRRQWCMEYTCCSVSHNNGFCYIAKFLVLPLSSTTQRLTWPTECWGLYGAVTLNFRDRFDPKLLDFFRIAYLTHLWSYVIFWVENLIKEKSSVFNEISGMCDFGTLQHNVDDITISVTFWRHTVRYLLNTTWKIITNKLRYLKYLCFLSF